MVYVWLLPVRLRRSGITFILGFGNISHSIACDIVILNSQKSPNNSLNAYLVSLSTVALKAITEPALMVSRQSTLMSVAMWWHSSSTRISQEVSLYFLSEA